jgi:hypothetical protein
MLCMSESTIRKNLTVSECIQQHLSSSKPAATEGDNLGVVDGVVDVVVDDADSDGDGDTGDPVLDFDFFFMVIVTS